MYMFIKSSAGKYYQHIKDYYCDIISFVQIIEVYNDSKFNKTL